MDFKCKEKEAFELLEYWLWIANDYDPDESIAFNAKKTNNALDMLEGMLLIYNIFAQKPLTLIEGNKVKLMVA